MAQLVELFERFLPKIEINCLSECWNWTAAKKETGYGLFAYDGKKAASAHRFAYMVLTAPIPKGLELDHLCRNRACVNPLHMEPVTHRENMARGTCLQTLNSQKTHCINGHELSGDNLAIEGRGYRKCKACHRKRSLDYVHKKNRTT